jgi:hypothetical protein
MARRLPGDWPAPRLLAMFHYAECSAAAAASDSDPTLKSEQPSMGRAEWRPCRLVVRRRGTVIAAYRP